MHPISPLRPLRPRPWMRGSCSLDHPPAGRFWEPGLTVVQLAGLGGIGELEVVEVGVLLDWLKISSSM